MIQANQLYKLKKIFLFFVTALFVASCQQHGDRLVILKNTNVIDVINGDINYKQDVILKDSMIFKIQPNYETDDNDLVIDASNKFIIPGLWDMHVHLDSWGYEPMAQIMVANGVLGARDMGGDHLDRLDSMRAKLGKSLPEMRIYRPGKMLDGKTDNWPFRITVTDSISAQNAVLANKKLGVDFIKVHQQLNKEAYISIAKTCKENGISFSGHVPHRVGAELASNLGQASFEHLTGTPSCIDEDCSNVKDLFELYKKNNTYQTPTLAVFYADYKKYHGIKMSDELKSYYNSATIDGFKLQDSINQQFMPPMGQMKKFSEMRWKRAVSTTQKMFEMNVPIMTGTDAGFIGVIPGFDIRQELELFVNHCKATPFQALQTATLYPAQFLKEEKLGEVKQGNYADFIILNSNPLENISATRDLFAVVSNGNYYDTNKLQQLKTQAKSNP